MKKIVLALLTIMLLLGCSPASLTAGKESAAPTTTVVASATITAQPDPNCPESTDQGRCVVPVHEGPHSNQPILNEQDCLKHESGCTPVPGQSIQVVCFTNGQELNGFDGRPSTVWCQTANGGFVFSKWFWPLPSSQRLNECTT